jgi:hypothetical protein
MKTPSRPRTRNVILMILAVAAIFGMFFISAQFHRAPEPKKNPVGHDSAQGGSRSQPFTAVVKTTPPGLGVMPDDSDFKLRPFSVAQETVSAQWTSADGKDTNVIRQLAHNPLEYARMVEENPRIFKRQLVYLKETAAAVFEQAKLTGEPVKQLTLPGVDGQELQFEIIKSDGKISSRQGAFSGHLAGNNDSLVTLAFLDGREAFTVLSPKENIFIVGEPREDGQVVVKAIDPDTYGVGPLDNDAIKTGAAKK